MNDRPQLWDPDCSTHWCPACMEPDSEGKQNWRELVMDRKSTTDDNLVLHCRTCLYEVNYRRDS